MQSALYVAIGGAFGALCRFWISKAINLQIDSAFPFATLAINLLGCFCIGSLYAALQHVQGFELWLKPLLIIGLLGGFTTFSSFAIELLQLTKQAQYAYAATYLLVSNIGGVALAFIGYKLFAA